MVAVAVAAPWSTGGAEPPRVCQRDLGLPPWPRELFRVPPGDLEVALCEGDFDRTAPAAGEF